MCRTARRACAAHDGVEVCEVASEGDAKCEDCKTGIITCEKHMKICGEICHTGCVFCLRYKCAQHQDYGCCPMVRDRVKEMQPIVKALEEKWEEEKRKREEERKQWEEDERKRAAEREALPPADGLVGQLTNPQTQTDDSHSVFRFVSSEATTLSGKHDGEPLTINSRADHAQLTEPCAPQCPKQGVDRSA